MTNLVRFIAIADEASDDDDRRGDTVNTAARMESSGIPGRVQVAPATWNEVRDKYRFERRELDVKGLGPMTTYLLVEG